MGINFYTKAILIYSRFSIIPSELFKKVHKQQTNSTYQLN